MLAAGAAACSAAQLWRSNARATAEPPPPPQLPAAAGAQGNIWKRAGWATMDELRQRLEELKELRDLVRSLGRWVAGLGTACGLRLLGVSLCESIRGSE